MHQKYIPNLSQIQPSLPTSQSFKYCKYQIKHTQFIIIIYIYSKFIPKFNLLSLYLSHSSTVKIQKNPKFSQMHQKCFPNLSQIQPSLPTSQSFKYCKYQIKHTQFIIIIYIYSKFIPKFNLLSLYLSHSSTVKIQKIPNFPKCIRNASQMYPKFNLLSLHLNHSNTVNIKSSIHSSS